MIYMLSAAQGISRCFEDASLSSKRFHMPPARRKSSGALSRLAGSDPIDLESEGAGDKKPTSSSLEDGRRIARARNPVKVEGVKSEITSDAHDDEPGLGPRVARHAKSEQGESNSDGLDEGSEEFDTPRRKKVRTQEWVKQVCKAREEPKQGFVTPKKNNHVKDAIGIGDDGDDGDASDHTSAVSEKICKAEMCSPDESKLKDVQCGSCDMTPFDLTVIELQLGSKFRLWQGNQYTNILCQHCWRTRSLRFSFLQSFQIPRWLECPENKWLLHMCSIAYISLRREGVSDPSALAIDMRVQVLMSLHDQISDLKAKQFFEVVPITDFADADARCPVGRRFDIVQMLVEGKKCLGFAVPTRRMPQLSCFKFPPGMAGGAGFFSERPEDWKKLATLATQPLPANVQLVNDGSVSKKRRNRIMPCPSLYTNMVVWVRLGKPPRDGVLTV
jgi:hypothetical protein